MIDWKLRTPSSYTTLFRNNETAIYNDIDTNPGTLEADIVTRTGINAQIVYVITQAMMKQRIIIRRDDLLGELRFWTASDWASQIIANIDNARTWMETPANEGKAISDMATDLAINVVIAGALADVLRFEGSAIIYEEE